VKTGGRAMNVRVRCPFCRRAITLNLKVLSKPWRAVADLAEALGLPDEVRERAEAIYRRALEMRLHLGRSKAAVGTGSLYLACRLAKLPVSFADISDVSGVDRKDVARCFRLLLRTFDISLPLIDPITYAAKIASSLNLSDGVKDLAAKVIRIALEGEVTAGKDPMGVAAAAVYIACVARNERITQKAIANVASITEVTIRNRCRALMTVNRIKELVGGVVGL